MKTLLTLFLLAFTLPATAQLLTEYDKQYHFAAGALVSAGTYTLVYAKTKSKKKALIYSVASSILIGTLKEIADSREKGNRFDKRDLLATTYGGLTIGVTFNIFTKKKP
jgi:putative lipoprotein